MLTQSYVVPASLSTEAKPTKRQNQTSMSNQLLRRVPIALCAALLTFYSASAIAQSDGKAAPGEANKERRMDDFAEASRSISGPAGNPECVWLGRRVVSLLWRDDLDTAFRHLDLYDRFGCPGPHIQQAFRCVVRQGSIDPKATDALHARVNQCWLNPSAAAQPATAATNPPASTLTTR
jgi:hypothetical protein